MQTHVVRHTHQLLKFLPAAKSILPRQNDFIGVANVLRDFYERPQRRIDIFFVLCTANIIGQAIRTDTIFQK